MRFRVASRMVPTIPANFPSKHRKRGQSLTCPSCSDPGVAGSGEEAQEPRLHLLSQSHLLHHCEAVQDLRGECDPQDDRSLAEFFKQVVARNMEIDALIT